MCSIHPALIVMILIIYIYGISELMPNIYSCLEYPNVTIPYNFIISEDKSNIFYKNETLYFYDKTIYYKGELYNNKFNGVGIMYNYDGSIYYEGVWFDGKKLKKYDFRNHNYIYYNHYDFYNADLCIFNAHYNYINNKRHYKFYSTSK
jgi:hypothetical protein